MGLSAQRAHCALAALELLMALATPPRRYRGRGCRVVCTQPRRISAVSVAERVAAERGEGIGENVGYTIRLDSRQAAASVPAPAAAECKAFATHEGCSGGDFGNTESMGARCPTFRAKRFTPLLPRRGGPDCSLVFCTNGVLLRMLTAGGDDPLANVTHLVREPISCCLQTQAASCTVPGPGALWANVPQGTADPD